MSAGAPLLEIEGLTVRYPAGGLLGRLAGRPAHVTILEGTSLAIGRGQTVGLIGESGSGKTTLGRAAMGLAPISAGQIRLGALSVGSERSSHWPQLRRRMTMMFQDAVAALNPRMRLWKSVSEPLAIHGATGGRRRDKAIELLDLVGLSAEFADRYPHQISGGQARRATVARALALEPEIVIADEPTAGLDLSVQGELLNLLNELQERRGVSFLFITHNLDIARHVTDRIAIMYLGRLVETGPSAAVFAHPSHPYTRALLAARGAEATGKLIIGDVPSLRERPGGCEFHTRCPLASDLCRRIAPPARGIGPGHVATCHFAEPAPAAPETPETQPSRERTVS
jgi:peptide/nickel transport system ATP-binding protein